MAIVLRNIDLKGIVPRDNCLASANLLVWDFDSRSWLGVRQLAAIVHIVDDDESFRVSTGRLLSASGYAVETYETAEQLLKRLPGDAIRCVWRWPTQRSHRPPAGLGFEINLNKHSAIWAPIISTFFCGTTLEAARLITAN